MRTTWPKRALWTVILGLALGGLMWFSWPRPIAVDLASVARGPMEVTVDDEGKAQVRHIYTVSAPIAGKVLRISNPIGESGYSLHVGDPVTAETTVVAVMQPMAPSFVDIRSREELEAAIAAADASTKQAEAEVLRIAAALDFSRVEFQRAQTLARTQTISVQAYDKAKFDLETNEAALLSAKAELEVRRSVRTSLAARLIGPSTPTGTSNPDCCVKIRAPMTGRVLKVIQESEMVVQPGAPLIEIGDPLDLQVVTDLLSTDAVQVKHGSPVRIDGWGGPPIQGRVTRVDPAGFVKISALGIEEQRVRATIDFTDPPEAWSPLGHDYRVIVHITTWSADNVLKVPVGALFRSGDSWAVFAVRERRARVAVVQIDHRNNQLAEVVSGLSAGDQVVLHPSDMVRNGVRVAARESH